MNRDLDASRHVQLMLAIRLPRDFQPVVYIVRGGLGLLSVEIVSEFYQNFGYLLFTFRCTSGPENDVRDWRFL